MNNIKQEIMDSFDELVKGDFQVYNSSQFETIRNKYGGKKLVKALGILADEEKIKHDDLGRIWNISKKHI